MTAKPLSPGQPAPRSGIYRVRHSSHRAEHRITAIKGERLPACRSCGRDVSFELVETAEYVHEERGFREVFSG
jgi:hypothetical protein